jgi:DNA-directed RNA polymerase II subunit RPB1
MRNLTEKEINDIVNSLTFFSENPEPLENVLQKHKNFIRKNLLRVRIDANQIPKLKETIIKAFYQSIISPGEAVGVNAAQCIAEPITQSTLSTFHHTGQSEKNVTLGFGRSKELTNCTSNQSTPTVSIYFKEKHNLAELHKTIDRLQQTLVNDLVDSYEVISPGNFKLEWWHKMFMKFHEMKKPNKSEWVARFIFNPKKIFERSITIREIADTIQKRYGDIRIVVSPYSLYTIDIIVNCSEITITGVKTPELQTLFENNDEEYVFEYYMKKIVMPELRKQHIVGIRNIESIYPRKENGSWVIDTDGTNLREILLIENIDTTKTVSNDIWEIYATLDIEAVREYLLQEFIKIISMGGNYINPRHIEVLVDKMCHTGTIRAMARYGIEEDQFSVISRASFEEVMKHFIHAAVGSEVDDIYSISPNIAVGKPIRAGTGFNEIKNVAIVRDEYE